jgi:hypothetical protein
VKADRRFLVFVLALSAVWWFFTLARGCQVARPRPAELIPPEQPSGKK